MESLKPELYTRTSLDSMDGVMGNDDEDKGANFLVGSPHSSPLGHIHFSLTYEEQKKTLIVKIIEAAHLPTPSPTPPLCSSSWSSSSSANRKDPLQSNP